MQGSNISNQSSSSLIKISTMIRVRPLNNDEQNEKQSIACVNGNKLEITLSSVKRFEQVEKLFHPNHTQREIFSNLQPIISQCKLGYNVTVMTYGQTGSGKTHTMFGRDWNNIVQGNKNKDIRSQSTFIHCIEQDQNHSGIIPRSINLIFNKLILHRQKFIKVYCSFLQLYNEIMLDLLQNDNNLAKNKKMFIHQNKNDGIYVENLNQFQVNTIQDCLNLLKQGQKNRIIRQTNMNIKSSRSHTIFQLLIQEIFPANKSYRRIKLNLCDLAGSQKICKNEKIQNQHFLELKNINLSLTTLGKVISSLTTNEKIPPFRDSKLTRLLQDSLKGNTSTAIIATITTKMSCCEESLNTIKFLQRANQIKMHIVSKIILQDHPQMRNLEKQIIYLKDMLKMKRNGVFISDVQMHAKLNQLKGENIKLRSQINQDLVQKLKKQNNELKRQLSYKNTEKVSEQYKFATIESKNDKNSNNLHKKKQIFSPSQQFISGTDDALSTNKNIRYNNKTNTSLFPQISTTHKTNYTTNKILQKIAQIEKTKKQNKIKLNKDLDQVCRNYTHEIQINKLSKTRKLKQNKHII